MQLLILGCVLSARLGHHHICCLFEKFTCKHTDDAEGAACVQTKGPQALAVLQQQKTEKQRIEDFRHSVEKRLRLRRLIRDATLPDAQFISCCKRMLYNSTSLSQIMEGLSFRISHVNQLSPEGTHIDIAWDFEV